MIRKLQGEQDDVDLSC